MQRAGQLVGDVPVLDARANSLSRRYAQLLEGHHPVTVFLSAAILGYLCLAGLTVGFGFFITKVLLSIGGVAHADGHFVTWLVSHRTSGRTEASLIGSIVAGGVVLPIVVGVAAVAFACVRKWRVAAFLIAAIGVEAATYRLTIAFVHRNRPDVHRLEHLQVNASYYSGHTAASIAVYAGLALVLTSMFRSRAFAAVCWTLAIMLPPYVAMARMYRGMHHPTDSATGVLVGIGCLLVALFAARASECAARSRRTARELRDARASGARA